jgi:hypothetical protein
MKKTTILLLSTAFLSRTLAAKTMRRIAGIILFLIIFGSFSPYAMAGMQEKQDISKMVQGADLIIRGKVISTESKWKEDSRGRHIYTSVNVKVLDKMKGDIKDSALAFEVVGGLVGDMGELVSDTPAFEADEDAIMFLTGHPLTVRQGISSKIRIQNGNVFRGNSGITADSFIRDLKILEKDPNAQVLQGKAYQDIIEETADIAQCYIYNNIRWPGTHPTISYYINENTSDCTGEGAAVQAAANTWNGVNANFTFQYMGTHYNTSSSQNFVNEIMWGTTSGSIATTYFWYYSPGEMFECDIVFNDPSYNWSSTTPGPSQMDVQTVGLHEFGHWLNLADLYNSEDSGNVMYGYGSNGQVKRVLQPCDISGICYIYGGCVQSYTLSVNSSGASGVSITSSTGHGGATNYTKTVSSGTSVNLQAPLYVGSCASRKYFNGWTGSVTSSNQSITFTMNGGKTVTANYVADPEIFTLSVNSSGASSVSISSSTGHEGITNYTKSVTCGTSVTLTAPSTSSGNIFNGWTGDVTSSSQTISFAMNGNNNVTANFISIKPVLHTEPNITPGLCNMISWDAVFNANAYYAECSSDPCFFVIDYSSNWITKRTYQFCGLSTCQEYWYRVKSGSSAWSQTSQAEFQGDTLTNAATTGGGDVILAGTGTIDTVGGTGMSETGENYYFNGFLVTTETTLTQIEIYLGISTTVSIEFVVYEGGTSFSDQYNRIHSSTLTSSGTGTKFYSSVPISVPLHAGRYYMFGAVCNGSVTTYFNAAISSPFFAEHAGWGYWSGFPSPDYLPNIATDPYTFYHRYTTTQSTGSGYVSPGGIVSTAINLPAGGNWGIADFNKTTPVNTVLTVDILPAAGSTPIPGYQNISAGTNIGGIAQSPIRLRANLSTSDSNSTPVLHDWSITYSPAGTESGWSNIESSIQVIPGDFEADCDVDWRDFAVLGSQWRQPAGTPSADIAPSPEGDGVVNTLDLAEFAIHWLEGN